MRTYDMSFSLSLGYPSLAFTTRPRHWYYHSRCWYSCSCFAIFAQIRNWIYQQKFEKANDLQ